MTPVWSQAQRAELDLEALDRETFCDVRFCHLDDTALGGLERTAP